jgi:hypothetical protein
MTYDLSGLASALLVTISLFGLFMQARLIVKRKTVFLSQKTLGENTAERPTETLSVNRFFASFLGFYSIGLYGLSLYEVNHYLLWPRVLAVSILLFILYQIYWDRRDKVSTSIFYIALVATIVAIAIPFIDIRLEVYSSGFPQVLIMVSTVLFLQGAIHQVVKIRREGRTGALSLAMNQLFLLKDSSTILFALFMGLEYGWPVLLFNGVSLIMQCVFIWHFHWVKVSPKAAMARQIAAL